MGIMNMLRGITEISFSGDIWVVDIFNQHEGKESKKPGINSVQVIIKRDYSRTALVHRTDGTMETWRVTEITSRIGLWPPGMIPHIRIKCERNYNGKTQYCHFKMPFSSCTVNDPDHYLDGYNRFNILMSKNLGPLKKKATVIRKNGSRGKTLTWVLVNPNEEGKKQGTLKLIIVETQREFDITYAELIKTFTGRRKDKQYLETIAFGNAKAGWPPIEEGLAQVEILSDDLSLCNETWFMD